MSLTSDYFRTEPLTPEDQYESVLTDTTLNVCFKYDCRFWLISPALRGHRVFLSLLWLRPPHLDKPPHGCEEAGLGRVEGQRLDNSFPHRQFQG